MKVIKDLPEVFEEFAEQRKNSFLAVKKLKEKDIQINPMIIPKKLRMNSKEKMWQN